jgi:N-acetylmuramoyl-L-alanine amidase
VVPQPYSDRFRGYSLFVSRQNAQPEASLACARAVGAALQQAGFVPTAHHAEPIEGENRPWADQARGVYFYDGLRVLRTAPMPALLVEAGVIVHREEARAAASDAYRARFAAALAQGLAGCRPSKTTHAPPQAASKASK